MKREAAFFSGLILSWPWPLLHFQSIILIIKFCHCGRSHVKLFSLAGTTFVKDSLANVSSLFPCQNISVSRMLQVQAKMLPFWERLPNSLESRHLSDLISTSLRTHIPHNRFCGFLYIFFPGGKMYVTIPEIHKHKMCFKKKGLTLMIQASNSRYWEKTNKLYSEGRARDTRAEPQLY